MQLWTMIQPHLNATRVEITTDISEATAIPWELIRNPHTGTFLALSVTSFVRTQRESRIRIAPGGEAEKVRILLVICRPHGGEDVPFRSVASRLVTRLSDEARDAFDLDVLRPPTYERLAETLVRARERGQPYHIVHFDGHGGGPWVRPSPGIPCALTCFRGPRMQQNSGAQRRENAGDRPKLFDKLNRGNANFAHRRHCEARLRRSNPVLGDNWIASLRSQ